MSAVRKNIALGLAFLAALTSGCSDADLESTGSIRLTGPRGLAACPTLRPVRPAAVAEVDAPCLETLARAGTRYAADLLRAEQACVDTNHPGSEVEGDPVHPCIGLRELSTGRYRVPGDEATAGRVREAAERFERSVRSACDDATLSRLDSCAETVDGAVECVRADHWESVQHLLREEYGDLLPIEDGEALACRTAVGAASANLVQTTAETMAECLLRGNDTSTCVGWVDAGRVIAPSDSVTAGRLEEATDEFLVAVRSACRAEHVGWVDSCGDDLRSMEECLLCAHRREAMYLIGAQLGGTPPPAETSFIDWASLANPVVEWSDRRIKDQVMAFDDGSFYVIGSINFADDDPDREEKRPTYVRSRDWRSWEEIPVPEDDTGRGGFASPDLVRLDGLWHVIFQKPDPEIPENRRLFLTTTPDLLTWTPRVEIVPNVLSEQSIIDGALARRHGRSHLLLKWRQEDLPWIAITAGTDLTAPWDFDDRLIAGTEQPFYGFAENGQFLEIDGKTRILATARDPEGFRCGSIYTCSHEPYLYDFAAGDGTAAADWTRWRHKTQLRLPYEAWNTVMHANTGFLADWRVHDGFFYLSYSGSTDHESFQGRGHGKIGLARSRDLMHWRLPGDLRD